MRASFPVIAILSLVAITSCGGSPAADDSDACLAFEQEKCRTDQICGNAAPCTMKCAQLPLPPDEQKLSECVATYKNLPLPTGTAPADVFNQLFACSTRSLTAVRCLLLFE